MIFLAPGDGRVYEQAIKVDDEESGGRQCFSEWTSTPATTARPPHVHREHHEALFVVAGTLTFTAGDEASEAAAGSFVFIPPRVVHTFSNRTRAPASCVSAYAPGGIRASSSRSARR